MEKGLLLLLLDRGRGLRGLGLDHPLLELVHSTGGIDELLRTSVEGMARIADTDNNHGLGGAGLDHVAAGATDFRVHIFGMYSFFHKRPEKIASIHPMTRGKFPEFPQTEGLSAAGVSAEIRLQSWPGFEGQSSDTLKLLNVVAHENQAAGECLSRDEQVPHKPPIGFSRAAVDLARDAQTRDR